MKYIILHAAMNTVGAGVKVAVVRVLVKVAVKVLNIIGLKATGEVIATHLGEKGSFRVRDIGFRDSSEFGAISAVGTTYAVNSIISLYINGPPEQTS